MECFADACLYAASTGIELVDALDAQLTDARQKLDGLRKDSSAWRVLPQLIEQPIINGKYLQETLGMSPMASSRALKVLAERGVLKESSGGRRSTVWEHRGVLSVLDDYAARLRRE